MRGILLIFVSGSNLYEENAMADTINPTTDPSIPADVSMRIVSANPVDAATSTSVCITFRYFPQDGSGEIVIPPSAHSLEGFRAWARSEDFPDRGRFTFASKELIIDMSPEHFETHNFLKNEITTVINQLVRSRSLGRVFADRALYSNELAGISTEPDAMFVSGESWRAGKCQVQRGGRPGICDELVGSPDWTLEILSPSSKRKDKKLLFEGYYRAGVGEYWLVDALGDDIDLLVYVPGESAYRRIEPTNGWTASPTFGCSFQLAREKAADGLWEYTLHIKEMQELRN